MKKVLVLLTLVATVSAYSQGTVNFNNFVSTANNGPISFDAGGPAAAGKINSALTVSVGNLSYGGINAMAGLYGGAPGTDPSQMVLLVPAVGFRSGTAAGYVNVGSLGSRTVTGIPGKSPADFVIKVWDVGAAGVASYEDAVTRVASQGTGYLGVSPIYHVTSLGGAGSPVDPPAPLPGLAAWSVSYVPEPSIIGLGILGTLAGLMVFRRRN